MNNQLIGLPRASAIVLATSVCGIGFTFNAFAQEALNEGTLVEQNRRARKQAIDRDLYNLKAGPVLARFDAVMGFEFNDNPQLVENPKEVDFVFHPEVDAAVLWALNSRNALALNIGVGYMKYVNNTELDHVVIAPSSEIALDVAAGDVLINLHERIAYTQNPASDPTVSGTGDFGGIENTVGTRVDWDLNHVVFSVGYDHYNFISISSDVSQQLQSRSGTTMRVTDAQDRSSDLFYGRAGMRVSPAILTGVEAGGGFTDYESDFFHDNTQWSVGPFVEAQITHDIKARAAGGYVRSDFESTGVSRAPKSVNDFYAELSVEHQLSQYMTHKLSVGREARAGAEAELVTMWYARYRNDWNLNRLSTLHATLFYENGKERSGVSERFWRVGAGLGITVPLSRKFNVTFGYQLIYKDSDLANRDYLQNVGSVEFRYTF